MESISSLINKLYEVSRESAVKNRIDQILSHSEITNDHLFEILSFKSNIPGDYQQKIWKHLNIKELTSDQFISLYTSSVSLSPKVSSRLVEYILAHVDDEKVLIYLLNDKVKQIAVNAANKILKLRSVDLKENLSIVAKHARHPMLRLAARAHPLLKEHFNAFDLCEISLEKT